MMSESMSYIALAPCGCLMAAALDVDSEETKKELAKEMPQWIRAGYTIEHVTSERVRKMEWKCNEHKVKS